ncbi:flagellin [Metaplanococcus flavidus]
MNIQHNLSAMKLNNNLAENNKLTAKSMEKLATGLRINLGADEAAGLSISEKMRTQIRGLEQAQRNIQDGISFIQTAESGLAKIADPNLQRLRQLSVQASSDTLSSSDKAAIQNEVNQILKNIDDIANDTKFNDINLLNVEGLKGTGSVPSTEKIISVKPGEQVTAGYIDVPSPANPGTLEVTALFGTISGAEWPDLNIVSPNGEGFGFHKENLSGSTYQENLDNASSTKATYSGYGSSDEKMTFENPVSGKWYIEISNSGGSEESTFKLQSNYLIHDETAVENPESPPGDIQLQIGANAGETFDMNLSDVRTAALGIENMKVDPWAEAVKSIEKLDAAIQQVSTERGKFGAYENALGYLYNNASTSALNLTAAESRIRDTDMAKEIINLTKNSILAETTQAMLAQANRKPQQVLELLK